MYRNTDTPISSKADVPLSVFHQKEEDDNSNLVTKIIGNEKKIGNVISY